MKMTKKQPRFFSFFDLLLWCLVAAGLLAYATHKKSNEIVTTDYCIRLNDSLYGIYELQRDTTISIKTTTGSILVLCENSVVKIGATDCRKRICTHQRLSAKGGAIICVPNRLVVEPQRKEESVDFIVQ